MSIAELPKIELLTSRFHRDLITKYCPRWSPLTAATRTSTKCARRLAGVFGMPGPIWTIHRTLIASHFGVILLSDAAFTYGVRRYDHVHCVVVAANPQYPGPPVQTELSNPPPPEG